MAKNLTFLKSLKTEEIILACVSLFFLILLLFFYFFADSSRITIQTGLANVAASINWWLGGVIVFFAFSILRIYFSLIKKNSWRSLLYCFRVEKLKNYRNRGLLLLRFFIVVIATTVLGMLVSGLIQQETKDRLMNLQILNADKFLTGTYPLFWLHSPSNYLSGFFNFLTPVIIYSFLSMAMVMGFLALVFYFNKDKKLFGGYMASIFIAFGLAMPFWYFFPVNAPANYLLHGNTDNFNTSLSQAIKNYQPNAKVAVFQEKTWETQRNAMPITTMPSMHWIWSMIIIYYIFKKWPKAIYPSLVWLSFNLFGTIYLGNHYLIDGLVAIPVAVLSLFAANLLMKLNVRENQ